MRPGNDLLYTTWGYVILGCVLEGAAREEYRALMKRMIFDPAGMSSTRDDDPRAISGIRGHGQQQGRKASAPSPPRQPLESPLAGLS